MSWARRLVRDIIPSRGPSGGLKPYPGYSCVQASHTPHSKCARQRHGKRHHLIIYGSCVRILRAGHIKSKHDTGVWTNISRISPCMRRGGESAERP
eukprot:3244630-Prymnesium_polylepis.2